MLLREAEQQPAVFLFVRSPLMWCCYFRRPPPEPSPRGHVLIETWRVITFVVLTNIAVLEKPAASKTHDTALEHVT